MSYLQQSMPVVPEQLREELVQHVAKACRRKLPSTLEAITAALADELRSHRRDTAMNGFVMCDGGKSEQLLAVAQPAAALGPFATGASEEHRLDLARRDALRAHADAITLGTSAAARLASLRHDAYGRIVQRARGDGTPVEPPDLRAELVSLTDGLIDPGCAVVHLALVGEVVELLWADGSAGSLELSRHVLADVDLAELAEALARPDYDTLVLLDTEDGAGMRLGRTIADLARARGVRELRLAPTRLLHGLPFGMLRIGEQQRLMDVVDISYAPSFAILQALRSQPERDGQDGLVAACGLHHAEDEAAFVHAAGAATISLVGAAATPSSVLAEMRQVRRIHLCCHGHYEATDALASCLQLSPDGPDGLLTAAQLLADGDLSGVELAVLGSCFSGAGQTSAATLDIAGGIDSAFLAAGARNVVSALWPIDDFAALIFHAEFYLALAEGKTLHQAFRVAVMCLRDGSWRGIATRPAGQLLTGLGTDLDAALAELVDDSDDTVDFSDPVYWAPFRLCGLGALDVR